MGMAALLSHPLKTHWLRLELIQKTSLSYGSLADIYSLAAKPKVNISNRFELSIKFTLRPGES